MWIPKYDFTVPDYLAWYHYSFYDTVPPWERIPYTECKRPEIFVTSYTKVRETDTKDKKEVVFEGRNDELLRILTNAYKHGMDGKGKPFDEQTVVKSTEKFGISLPLGMVSEKIEKVQTIKNKEEAVKELLDTIIYCSAAILHLEKNDEKR